MKNTRILSKPAIKSYGSLKVITKAHKSKPGDGMRGRGIRGGGGGGGSDC